MTDLPTESMPIAIPTPTKKIWKALMKYLDKLGVKWKDARPLDYYDNWDTYAEKTYIVLHFNKTITFGRKPLSASKAVVWKPLSTVQVLRKRIGSPYDTKRI